MNLLLYQQLLGHMKPLISLIVRMAECREDVIMTYLVDEKLDKVMDELAELSDQRLKKIEGRIQCVVRRTRFFQLQRL